MAVWIEWLDGGKLQRGELKKEDKSKLHLISSTGRNVSVPQKRFFLRHPSVDDGEAYFQRVEARAAEIDLELLHDSVGAGQAFSLQSLATCWFSADKPEVLDLSAVLNACMDGMPWFKVDNAGKVLSNKPEEIERFRKKEEADKHLAQEKEAASQLLISGIKGSVSKPDDEFGRDLFQRLKAYLLQSCYEGRPLNEPKGFVEGLDIAARTTSLEPIHVVRQWLDNIDLLPDPYQVYMMRFNRTWLGAKAAQEETFPPCETRYAPASDDEIARIAEATTALADTLPESLHKTLFSVDDEGVEEIDDALSAERIDDTRFRVGVHIAAPGLVISEESEIHTRACLRCTTVYQPDLKWTMLPKEVIDGFSLRAGKRLPAVSTYYTFSSDTFELLDAEVRLETVNLTANYSYKGLDDALDGVFYPDLKKVRYEPEKAYRWLDEDVRTFPYARMDDFPAEAAEVVDLLVPLARHLLVKRVRGGADLFYRREYRIKVPAPDRVEITERTQNSIIEGVVSEMMILNNGWVANRLAEADQPAIYRTQRQVPVGDVGGRTVYRTQADLTVIPREHAGLGTTLYCWSTSPLRRYADLLNQRQLAALSGGNLPAYKDTSELLVRAKQTEFQNKAANDHQRRIERFWVMKFVEHQGEAPFPAEIRRQQKEERIFFLELPLSVDLDPDLEIPSGALGFMPDGFDYFGLHVSGKLEPLLKPESE